MTRIVTTTYRYKRPPKKPKAATIVGPAIVRAAKPSRDRAAAEASQRLKELMKPGEPVKAPEPARPAIVTTTSKKRLKLLREERAAQDNGQETPESVKAFFARMMHPPGGTPPKRK